MSGFTAHLRRHGFTVGPAETKLVLSVLAAEEFPDVSTVRLGLKTLLSGNRDQWAHFDDLFDAFWFGRGLRAVAPAQAEAGVRNPKSPARDLGQGAAARRDRLGN